MGNIWQKLWDKFGNIMGYFGKNYWIYYGIYWLTIIGYICHNYGIQWSVGYIKQKLRNLLGIMGYIGQTLWDILGKTMGYIGINL